MNFKLSINIETGVATLLFDFEDEKINKLASKLGLREKIDREYPDRQYCSGRLRNE